MVDTVRSLADLQALLADNSVGNISPQDVRDFLVSAIPTGRAPTFVVAASGASQARKNGADYVCDGVADDVEIQAAIDALPAGGGTVILSEGTFTTAATIILDNTSQRLVGQGMGATTVKASANTFDVLRVGSFVVAKVSFNAVEKLTIDIPAGAAEAVGLAVNGVTNLAVRNMQVKGGFYGVTLRNADRFLFENVRIQDYESAGIRGLQGASEDVTIGSFITVDTAGSVASSVGLLFDEFEAGSNEFNRLMFLGCRIHGGSAAGTIGMRFLVGARNITFIGTVFQNNLTAHIDGAALISATDRIRVNFIGCQLVNSSAAGAVPDIIKLNTSNVALWFANCTFDRATDLLDVSANSPRVYFGPGMELFNITNKISGAGTPLVRNYGDEGLKTANSGTATIANGTTSVVVTHGLDVTPTLDDISVVLGENPTNDPGIIWVSTITATQFTVNCRSDPGVSNLDFGWRVEV